MVILIFGPCDCATATTPGCVSQLTVTASSRCSNWGAHARRVHVFGALAETNGLRLDANEVTKFQSPRSPARESACAPRSYANHTRTPPGPGRIARAHLRRVSAVFCPRTAGADW